MVEEADALLPGLRRERLFVDEEHGSLATARQALSSIDTR